MRRRVRFVPGSACGAAFPSFPCFGSGGACGAAIHLFYHIFLSVPSKTGGVVGLSWGSALGLLSQASGHPARVVGLRLGCCPRPPDTPPPTLGKPSKFTKRTFGHLG
eukprot:gene11810-biopygen21427